MSVDRMPIVFVFFGFFSKLVSCSFLFLHFLSEPAFSSTSTTCASACDPFKGPAELHRCFHLFWLIRPLLRLSLGRARLVCETQLRRREGMVINQESETFLKKTETYVNHVVIMSAVHTNTKKKSKMQYAFHHPYISI